MLTKGFVSCFFLCRAFFYITKDDSPAQIVVMMDVWKT